MMINISNYGIQLREIEVQSRFIQDELITMFLKSLHLFSKFKNFERPNSGIQLFKLMTNPNGYSMKPLNIIERIEKEEKKFVIMERPIGFGRHAFLSMIESYHDLLLKKNFEDTFTHTPYQHMSSIIPPNTKTVLNIYFGSLQVDSEHFSKEFWRCIIDACRVYLQRYKNFLPYSSQKIDLYSNNGPSILDQVLDIASKIDFSCIVLIDDYNIPFHRNLKNISNILFTYQHGNPSNSHVFQGYINDSHEVEKNYDDFIDIILKYKNNERIDKIIIGSVYPVNLSPSNNLSSNLELTNEDIYYRLKNDSEYIKDFGITQKSLENIVRNFIPEDKHVEAFDLFAKYCNGYNFSVGSPLYNMAQISNFLELSSKKQMLPSEEELQRINVFHPFIIDVIIKSSLGCQVLVKLGLSRDEGLSLIEPLIDTFPISIEKLLHSITFSENFLLSLLFHSGLITYSNLNEDNKRVRVTNMNAAWKIIDAMINKLSWDALNIFKEMKEDIYNMILNDDTSGVEEFFFTTQTKEYGYSRWRNIEVTENSEQIISLFLMFHLNGLFPTYDAHKNLSRENGCADLLFFLQKYKTFIIYKNVFPYEVITPSGRTYSYSKENFNNRGNWDDGIAIDKELVELSREGFLNLKFSNDAIRKDFNTIKDMKRKLNSEALKLIEEHNEITGETAKGFVIFQCGSRIKIKKVKENLYN